MTMTWMILYQQAPILQRAAPMLHAIHPAGVKQMHDGDRLASGIEA